MKIGFIYSGFINTPGDGVVSQARKWKHALEMRSHEVIFLNPWEYNDLTTFDIIQIFSFDSQSAPLINNLYKKNNNIVVAPIVDPDYSIFNCWLRTHCGINKLSLSNRFHGLRSVKDKIKYVLTRSEFESSYIVKGFGFSPQQCKIVMLNPGISSPVKFDLSEKEPFCFHMSLVTDERKNVKRLIDAAVKYNFKLILAGAIHFEEEREKFSKLIEGHDNISYLGFISEEQKADLYRRAKVFALPSINEGVGLVALEAAMYGCDIVITNIGGPKEYYGNLAEIVDPYNIDSIGQSVVKLLSNHTYQPDLSEKISKEFSIETSGLQLESIYQSIL